MHNNTQVTETALDSLKFTLSSIALELHSIIEKINSTLQNLVDILFIESLSTSFDSVQSGILDITSTIISFRICYDSTLKTFSFRIRYTNKHVNISKEPSILKRPCSKPAV